MIIHLDQGRTWTPTIEIAQDGTPFDCTDYTVLLFIKDEYNEAAPLTLTLTAEWSDRVNGKGFFDLTHAQSKALTPRTYYYEVVICTTADLALVKTLDDGKLIITTTLEKDIL